MSKQLLESDFITIDIRSVLNNPKTAENTNSETPNKQQVTGQASTPQARPTNFDWGEELKRRLEANKKMSQEARRPSYDIETKFFKEFFAANWDAECAEQLMLMGDPLRKAIKVLGFKNRINPVLGFISLSYVQKNLIKTKLLNINTFKAIYNAIANKWVADSEFFRVSTYNIIYCKDLYTKPLKEIEEYLELQSKVLEVSASVYTEELQSVNKKVFLYLPNIKELEFTKRIDKIKSYEDNAKLPSVKSDKSKLNSLEFAKLCVSKIAGKSLSTKVSKSHLNSNGQQALAKKLDTPAKMLAAIQFISINTESEEAQKALQNDLLKTVATKNLLDATKWLASQNIMPRGQLSTADANSLVLAILNNLQK